MNEKLNFIKQLSFFNSLDNEKLNIIDNISKVITYPKNSILYYENDINNKLFFLVSGLLKVYKIDKFENEIFLY
ncbi:cyclic nucleotide-binding domain-containing protein, partial [Sulfurimonas sp. RIFOXYB12_FULL_35_9]